MVNAVAVRLGTEGKAQVKQDFAEVGTAGTGAMKAIGDGARQAADVGEAQARRIVNSFDRATADLEAAERKRAAASAKLAAIQPQTAMQMRINDSVGTGYSQPEGSAKASAIAIGQLIAAQEQMEARALALRAAIDPAWAAQQRFNAEMAEARTLLAAGAISTELYAGAQTRAKAALDQATRSARLNAESTGSQRAGMMQLNMQLNDMATMWAMGAKPQQIFVSQMGQVIQAVSLLQGGAGKFSAFMTGPWGAAITVGALVLTPLIGKLLESEERMKAVELASDGMGQAQSTLGQMFDLTTGKIKSQNDMLRLNAQLLSANLRAEALAAGSEANEAATSAGQFGSFAARPSGFRTRQRAVHTPTAAEQLLRDVISGKVDGTQAFDRSSGWNFDSLKITKQEFQQALAKAAEARAKGATADLIDKSLKDKALAPELRQTPAAKKTPSAGNGRAETLARESEATDGLIVNLGRLADAYLISDAAAMRAEITAKATEQGIKKQADVTAYVDRQMRLAVAQRTADGAKSVAIMSQENDARELLNERVRTGAMTAQRAEQAMRDEAQLRPQLTAAAMAEGEAKAKLFAIVEKLRKEQQRGNEATRATKVQQYDADFRDGMELADEELRLITRSASERERALNILRLKQQLDRDGIDAATEEGQLILANREALLRKNEAIQAAARDWQEVQRFGESFIDTVLDPSAWDDWGSLGKKVLNDLMQEMLLLSAINPLKNALFGSELPTSGGFLGALGGLGKGSSSIAEGENNMLNQLLGRAGGIFGFASGTEYFAGGMARVGEHGEENVFLPRGSKIMTAGETRRMNSGGAMTISMPITIDATGADAAGLARVEQQFARFQSEIPGKILSTVADARQRGLLRG